MKHQRIRSSFSRRRRSTKLHSLTTKHTMIMSPLDSGLWYWKTFMVVLSACSAWTYPFEAAFLPPIAKIQSLKQFYPVDKLISFFFLLDLVLTFFVSYFDSKTKLFVRDPKKIALRYLKTWFIVDVASTLPIQLVSYFLHGKYSMYNVLGFIRLSRLRHVKRFFYRMEIDTRFSLFWVTFAKVYCVTQFAVHYHFLKLWNAHEELRHGHYRNPAEKAFLMIYCGFFKLGLPTYAIRCIKDLIYTFFDCFTVEPEFKEPKDPNEILELFDRIYGEGLDEDQNLLVHSKFAAWLDVGNDE